MGWGIRSVSSRQYERGARGPPTTPIFGPELGKKSEKSHSGSKSLLGPRNAKKGGIPPFLQNGRVVVEEIRVVDKCHG